MSPHLGNKNTCKNIGALATARCRTLRFYSYNGSDKTQTLCFYSHNGSDKTATLCFYSYFVLCNEKMFENQLKLGLASWSPKMIILKSMKSGPGQLEPQNGYSLIRI